MTYPAIPLAGRIPDNLRVYVIGDVHGCADLLDDMADQVHRHRQESPRDRTIVIMLGDYVDRGSDSFLVVDKLLSGLFQTETVLLKGNHEAVLLDFLDGKLPLAYWSRVGGIETIESYRRRRPDLRHTFEASDPDAHAKFAQLIPDSHMAFFRNLPISISIGDFFFCHAGVKPGVALTLQRQDDLLWIRDEFLDSRTDFGKIVVHGHTPAPDVEILPNRINVDTGAYRTGCLSCVALDENGYTILRSRR